ncbi:acyl-CoA dehydrogenase family protein [Nocardia vaccinii]|uniref:acyl-CoA dehydrogenase family protein n=1 Tax=Nocardia vaccinii TaxID=1822 RepID=UPI000830EFF6|nr:acyl-CoA dehydrogenase family protein [Nocardia vaccinii]
MINGKPFRSYSPFVGDEELFRGAVRSFLDREVDARVAEYEDGSLPIRHLWKVGASEGIIGVRVPEQFGGQGAPAIFNIVVSYELGRSIGYATVGTSICTDNATNLLLVGGSDAAKAELLPRILDGQIQAMGFTEPDAGTNSSNLRTSARRDGDEWVINGNKCFISMGDQADIIYVVTRTDGDADRAGRFTLFAVDAPTDGLQRRKLDALGLPVHGLGELFFDDVRVPAHRMIGPLGGGLKMLSGMMAIDRVQTPARALGQAELALDLVIEYAKIRRVHEGRPLIEFQNTKMKLAEMATQIRAAQTLLTEALDKMRNGVLTNTDSAICKVFLTDVSARVVDESVQLFGANGLAGENVMSRIYASNRQFRILAGTSELLKISIASRL